MKKLLFLSIFFSIPLHSIMMFHTHAFSKKTKLLSGTAITTVGLTGFFYYYKKIKLLEKQLAAAKADPLANDLLVKQYTKFKKLALLSGGISIVGLALASWGGWEWYQETQKQMGWLHHTKGFSYKKIGTNRFLIRDNGKLKIRLGNIDTINDEDIANIPSFINEIVRTLAKEDPIYENWLIKLTIKAFSSMNAEKPLTVEEIFALGETTKIFRAAIIEAKKQDSHSQRKTRHVIGKEPENYDL